MKLVRCAEVLFFVALAMYVVFISSLPVFPTGDGPLHIYYANVFGTLIHGSSRYGQFYAIRHIIQPYCFHYFLLILLEKAMTPEAAEKLFTMAIVMNMAFGFRYLVRSLGNNAVIAALFFIPLLCSWTLLAGFLNFCFASGLLYWALGLYVRLDGVVAGTRRVLVYFVCALFLLVLSHPVPLMILIALIGGDIILRILGGAPGQRFKLNGYVLSAFALSCVAFVAPIMLADKGRLSSSAKDFHPHIDLIKDMVSGRYLGMFAGNNPVALLSRYGTLLIAPLSIFVFASTFASHCKRHTLTAADRLFILAIVLLLGTLTLPHAINGSYYFPQRMWDIAWPLVLAATAAATLSKVRSQVLVTLAVGLIVVTFATAWPVLREAAHRQEELSMLRLPHGQRGLLVVPDTAIHGDTSKTTYPVFYWGGARSFMKNNDVLLNSPWLDLTTMPLKSKLNGELLMDKLPNKYGEHPYDVEAALAGSGYVRDQMLNTADFLLFTDPVTPELNPLYQMGTLLRERAGQWTCQSGDVYAICVKNSGTVQRPLHDPGSSGS